MLDTIYYSEKDDRSRDDIILSFAWFKLESYSVHFGPIRRKTYVRIPLYAPLLLYALYLGFFVVQRPIQRYWRYKRGLCPTCAYSLMGNLSGICPECGSVIPDDLLENMKDKTTDT